MNEKPSPEPDMLTQEEIHRLRHEAREDGEWARKRFAHLRPKPADGDNKPRRRTVGDT